MAAISLYLIGTSEQVQDIKNQVARKQIPALPLAELILATISPPSTPRTESGQKHTTMLGSARCNHITAY